MGTLADLEAEWEAEAYRERMEGDGPYEEPRICCPRHPWVVISNGTFDAPCGCCEYEMETGEKVTSPHVVQKAEGSSVPISLDDSDSLFNDSDDIPF